MHALFDFEHSHCVNWKNSDITLHLPPPHTSPMFITLPPPSFLLSLLSSSSTPLLAAYHDLTRLTTNFNSWITTE
jgi:hypothetical protein